MTYHIMMFCFLSHNDVLLLSLRLGDEVVKVVKVVKAVSLCEKIYRHWVVLQFFLITVSTVTLTVKVILQYLFRAFSG